MKMGTQQSKNYGMQQSSSKGKVIVIQAYVRKQEKSQINNLDLYLKWLEKEEQTNPKLVEWKKS